MRNRVALVVPACIAMSVGSPAIAADIPLPTGSYLQTCKVVSFDQATGDLAANCEGPKVGMFGLGTPDTSHMNVRGCKEGTIWNDRRQLYCLSAQPWGNDRVIPAGSYIDTCTDRKVLANGLLVATCGTPAGISKNASLDLRACNWGKDISNRNGTLDCERTFSTAIGTSRVSGGDSDEAAPVKPVAVEPGVVKPVTIAPIAPTGDGTTSDTKGRKRKRDRGERG